MTVVVRARGLKTLLGASVAVSLLALSACTSNSSFPSPSISAALTPQESDLASAQTKKDGGKLVPPADLTGNKLAEKEATKTEETQLALAPSATNSPSVDAATSAVKPETFTPTPKSSPNKESASEPEKVARSKPDTAQTVETPEKVKPAQRKGFFANLFRSPANKPKRDDGETKITKTRKPAPRVRLSARKRVSTTSADRPGIRGLPGVKRRNIFDIDEEEHEELDEPMRTASIANLATRGRHGLLLQRPDVKVGCFTRPLLSILKRVERRYKRKPIVTSGYRSPRYNRMVRGARKSTHIRCMAADIQVKGVSKWKLAKFLRSLPGRGGVGTYCHTKSVHIDVAKKRAWHHCRRSRKKRRRKA